MVTGLLFSHLPLQHCAGGCQDAHFTAVVTGKGGDHSLLTPQSLDQKFVVVSTGTILLCFGLHCFCQSAKESEPLLGP